MLEDAGNEEFLHACRAGQLLDSFVELGEQAVAELAKIGRAGFGLAAFEVGFARLSENACNASDE